MTQPVRIGVYEKSMPNEMTMAQKLHTARKAGFDYMEISIDESDEKLARLSANAFLYELSEAVKQTGLPVPTMCLSGHRRFPLGSHDPKTRERGMEIMEQAIRFSASAGIRIIQLAGYDVYYEQGDSATRAAFFQNLRDSVGIASAFGVTLAFETMETDFMNTVEKAMRYVNALHSPYLQVYPDIGNVRNATDRYLEDLKTGQGHIAAVHLKETVPGVYRDMQFGDGRVDFDGCISALRGMGVGMFTCEFWYDGMSDPYEYLCKTKQFFESRF